jgi:hypothetical protein
MNRRKRIITEEKIMHTGNFLNAILKDLTQSPYLGNVRLKELAKQYNTHDNHFYIGVKLGYFTRISEGMYTSKVDKFYPNTIRKYIVEVRDFQCKNERRLKEKNSKIEAKVMAKHVNGINQIQFPVGTKSESISNGRAISFLWGLIKINY